MSAEVLTGEIVRYGEPVGRPTKLTTEVADEICRRLSCGEPLTRICKLDHMPSLASVYSWLGNPEHSEFLDRYNQAREWQGDTLFDEQIEIADDGTNDYMEQHDKDGALIGWRVNGENIQRSALRIKTRQWQAARLRPKKYGDNTILRHADAEGEKLPSQDQSILELARIVAFALSKADKIMDKGVTIEQEG
jgi:hypothetical protein